MGSVDAQAAPFAPHHRRMLRASPRRRFMRPTAKSDPSTAPSPSSVLAARVGPASQRILSGPLALEIARFGVPLAVGMGLQTSFNLVDAYIISGLGGSKASAALGAIGVADLIGAVGTILSYGLSI